MITIKLEKNKTTIIIPRRLKRSELNTVLSYLEQFEDEPPKKRVSKKTIQELAKEINATAWKKIKKKRGFTWL